jgi:hypothetical protein
MDNFSPLIEMQGHFEWLSHYLHICCELNGFRCMLGYRISGDHNRSITSSVCEQTSQRGEMKCRQETVAEGDRIKSTEELHCAAFDATASASTPIKAFTSDKNHPIRDYPGTRI